MRGVEAMDTRGGRSGGRIRRLAGRSSQKGKDAMRADGRPLAQWPRPKAGYSDDPGTGRR